MTIKKGLLAAVRVVGPQHELMIISAEGVVIRVKVKDISELGRSTQGVKIMNVGEDANIIALAKVIKEDELDGESGEKKPTAAKEKESGEDQEQMKL